MQRAGDSPLGLVEGGVGLGGGGRVRGAVGGAERGKGAESRVRARMSRELGTPGKGGIGMGALLAQTQVSDEE